MERQRSFEAAKTDLDRTYSRKVLTLYEKTRRCEDDTAQQLRQADQRNKDLQSRLESLQKQFDRLESENLTLRDDIKQVTKNMLPPELLNEAEEKLVSNKWTFSFCFPKQILCFFFCRNCWKRSCMKCRSQRHFTKNSGQRLYEKCTS